MAKEYKPKYQREYSQDKFQKIKSEIEKRFEEEHPFKPHVNYATVFTPTAERYPECKEDFFKRLSSPKTIEVNKRLKEKEMNEFQKFEEECTFVPNSEKKLKENKPRESERITNRLHRLAEQLREKREKLKREYQENAYGSYSFKPEIDNTSKQLMMKYDTKPIHERVKY
jgi:hypothetical protein